MARVDNALVAVDPAAPGPGRVLAEGHDFYASAKLSPDGTRLAWLTWDHPNMPWVGTQLWLAEIAEDGGLTPPRLVAGGDAESVFQPQWSPDGVLYFVSDRTGWWNLYRCDPTTARSIRSARATPSSARRNGCSGNRPTPFCRPTSSSAPMTRTGIGRLARLDIATGQLAPLDLPYTAFGGIRVAGGRIVCRAGLADPADRDRRDRPGDRRGRGVAPVGAGRHRRCSAPLFLGAAAHRVPDRGRPDRLRALLPPGQPGFRAARGRETAAGRQMPRRPDLRRLDDAEPRHPVLDEPRHRRARCRLRRQHRLWPRLSRAA